MPAKLTTQEFIDRARATHNHKYGYAFSVYQSAHEKVMIHCPEHGIFEQTPSAHMFGSGCKRCSGNIQKTKDSFIKEATSVHGDTYDYTLVDYISSNTPVKITCKKHGVFEQRPNTHINRKQGCRLCSGFAKDDLLSFVSKANKVHDNKYDYSLVDYISSQKNVSIICKSHGMFSQRPNDHINGVGCPGCSNWGFNVTKNGFVYLLGSECGRYIKIGITHAPKRRHSQLKRATPFKFHVIECIKGVGSLVADTERELLNQFEPVKFATTFDGSTEWRLWSDEIRTKMWTLMNKGDRHVQKNTESTTS